MDKSNWINIRASLTTINLDDLVEIGQDHFSWSKMSWLILLFPVHGKSLVIVCMSEHCIRNDSKPMCSDRNRHFIKTPMDLIEFDPQTITESAPDPKSVYRRITFAIEPIRKNSSMICLKLLPYDAEINGAGKSVMKIRIAQVLSTSLKKQAVTDVQRNM